jgi:hypothetical protein
MNETVHMCLSAMDWILMSAVSVGYVAWSPCGKSNYKPPDCRNNPEMLHTTASSHIYPVSSIP